MYFTCFCNYLLRATTSWHLQYLLRKSVWKCFSMYSHARLCGLLSYFLHFWGHLCSLAELIVAFPWWDFVLVNFPVKFGIRTFGFFWPEPFKLIFEKAWIFWKFSFHIGSWECSTKLEREPFRIKGPISLSGLKVQYQRICESLSPRCFRPSEIAVVRSRNTQENI